MLCYLIKPSTMTDKEMESPECMKQIKVQVGKFRDRLMASQRFCPSYCVLWNMWSQEKKWKPSFLGNRKPPQRPSPCWAHSHSFVIPAATLSAVSFGFRYSPPSSWCCFYRRPGTSWPDLPQVSVPETKVVLLTHSPTWTSCLASESPGRCSPPRRPSCYPVLVTISAPRPACDCSPTSSILSVFFVCHLAPFLVRTALSCCSLASQPPRCPCLIWAVFPARTP